jgi:hypothetical protein
LHKRPRANNSLRIPQSIHPAAPSTFSLLNTYF